MLPELKMLLTRRILCIILKLDMKTAQKKDFTPKGFSPIVIVVVLAVIGVGIFAIYNLKTKQNPTPASQQTSVNQQTAQANKQNNQKLAEAETDAYIFYYPENYVEMTKAGKDMLGYTQAYHNPNSKSQFSDNIFLKITKENKKLGAFNFKQCEGFAESNRKSTNEKIEVTVVNDPVENGCEITSTDEYNLVTKQKLVWSKDPNDLNVYTVKGMYQADDSNQGDNINLAITAFTLKP